MDKATLTQRLKDKQARLENARYYKTVTAPGGLAESARSHEQWTALEAQLAEDVVELEAQLKTAKK